MYEEVKRNKRAAIQVCTRGESKPERPGTPFR